MSIKWKSEYSVQVKEIDGQHQNLVVLIDKLYIALNENKGKRILANILNDLIDFGVYHFATEEKYFDKFNYEFAEEHKKIHRGFETKLADFKKKFKNNEIEVSFELIDFLEDWLLDHLITADQKYVQCFTENGLK
jgi:hemerythrin